MTVYHGPYAVFNDAELRRIHELVSRTGSDGNAPRLIAEDDSIKAKIDAVFASPLAHRKPDDEKIAASKTIGQAL